MPSSIDQLRQQCSARVAAGEDLFDLRDEFCHQGNSAVAVEMVLSELAAEGHPIRQVMEERKFWANLAKAGRELLDAGQTLIDVYLQTHTKCQEFYGDAQRALAAARTATEAIGSVHGRHTLAPLNEKKFLAAFLADVDFLQSGPPAGRTSAIYPEHIPAQFFQDPEAFLDMCERLGARSLEVLWATTPGCEGELVTGMSHSGRLKDGRRYLVLRLPPPQQRFEAHFLAFVGHNEASPARLFALERGVSTEEAVVCECYPDGRLRLGAAGPAESKNFIRLVRQQLGL